MSNSAYDKAHSKSIVLAKRLVGISDVAMENMRPGVMKRLGLGYEELVKVKDMIASTLAVMVLWGQVE